jgi:hypothetical protein
MVSQAAAIGAKKPATQIGHFDTKFGRGKLNANTLIPAVIGLAGWAGLRQPDAAGRAAIRATQFLAPLIALGHLLRCTFPC